MKLSWHEKMILDAALNVIKVHLPDKTTAALDIGYNGSFITFNKDHSELFAMFILEDDTGAKRQKLSEAFNEYLESIDD